MDEKEETNGQLPSILHGSDSTGDLLPLKKLTKSKSFKKDRKVAEGMEPGVVVENVPQGLGNIPEDPLVSNREIIVRSFIVNSDNINYNDKLLTKTLMLDPSLPLSLPLGSHHSLPLAPSSSIFDIKNMQIANTSVTSTLLPPFLGTIDSDVLIENRMININERNERKKNESWDVPRTGTDDNNAEIENIVNLIDKELEVCTNSTTNIHINNNSTNETMKLMLNDNVSSDLLATSISYDITNIDCIESNLKEKQCNVQDKNVFLETIAVLDNPVQEKVITEETTTTFKIFNSSEIFQNENNVDSHDENEMKNKDEDKEIISDINNVLPNIRGDVGDVDDESDSYEFINSIGLEMNDTDTRKLIEKDIPANISNVTCNSKVKGCEGEVEVDTAIGKCIPKGMAFLEEITDLCSIEEKDVPAKTKDKEVEEEVGDKDDDEEEEEGEEEEEDDDEEEEEGDEEDDEDDEGEEEEEEEDANENDNDYPDDEQRQGGENGGAIGDLMHQQQEEYDDNFSTESEENLQHIEVCLASEESGE